MAKTKKFTSDQMLQVLKHLAPYREDPKLFVEQALGKTPNIWQAEFLDHLLTNSRIAIKSGHGVGKSTAAAWAVIFFLVFHSDIKILITGVSFGNLQKGVFNEIKKLIRETKFLNRMFVTNSSEIKNALLPDHVFATIQTASKDNTEALQGIRGKKTVILIDEASGIEQECFDAVNSILMDPTTQMIMLGNPMYASGAFYDAFEKLSHRYFTLTVSCLDYLCYDLTSSDPNHRVNPLDIEDYELTLSQSQFNARVLGEFPVDDETVLVSSMDFTTAVDNENIIASRYNGIFWGLDVAMGGGDKTMLVKRHGPVVYEIKQINNSDPVELVHMVMAEYGEEVQCGRKPEQIFIDGTGNGFPIYSQLANAGLPVTKVVFGASTSDPNDGMFNVRAEMYWRLSELFKRSDISLAGIDHPTLEMLKKELAAHQSFLTTRGQIQIIPKKDVVRKVGHSPDIADALALVFRHDWAIQLNTGIRRQTANWVV
jgi:phage terminase large subunit